MNTDEILTFQIALAKKVVHKTGNSFFPVEFQLSIYEQCNKDIRMNKINNNNGSSLKNATSKQKKLMDDLHIKYTDDIDVKTASKKISEALNKE